MRRKAPSSKLRTRVSQKLCNILQYLFDLFKLQQKQLIIYCVAQSEATFLLIL